MSTSLLALARAAMALPDIRVRGEKIVSALEDAAESGLGLSRQTVEALAHAETRRFRWLSVALWIIAADSADGGSESLLFGRLLLGFSSGRRFRGLALSCRFFLRRSILFRSRHRRLHLSTR